MSGFLFVAWPYVALVLAVLGGLSRYFARRYTYSTLSSQMLAPRGVYWGSVPWHYGIVPILLAHLFAGLFPGATLAVVSHPPALFALELAGVALALLCVLGIVTLFVRRLGPSLRRVTSGMDWVLLLVLGLQVVTGAAIALFVRWGSRWYPYTATPWFWSIAQLAPDPAPVVALPALVHVHMVNGFLVFALFPFTRLVHLVTAPITYLWRPYQVVTWRGPRGPRGAAP